MNDRPEPSDPLIDACLDELLGDQSPPDLTERILAALEEQRESQPLRLDELPQQELADLNSVVAERARSVSSVDDAQMLRPMRDWNRLLIGISLVVIVSLSLFVILQRDRNNIAEVDPPTERAPNPDLVPPTSDGEDIDSESVETPGVSTPPQRNDRRRPNPPRVVQEPPAETPEVELPSVTPPQLARLDDDAVVEFIDQRLAAGWEAADVVASRSADDRQWCIRVYQQLIDRDPNPTELARFVRSSDDSKREALVDSLLGDRYANRFADVWASRLVDWLLPASQGQERARSNAWKTYRAGLRTHLVQSLKSEQPYDELVRGLLTATGSNDSRREDFDAATNYMLALVDEDRAEVTSQVCRTVIGNRIRCAQCHDDSQAGVTQREFWEMASVFNTVRVDMSRPGRGKIRDQDAFVAEARYQTADGTWKTATSDFLEATSEPVPLRQRLADRLIKSPEFAQTTINRLWAELLIYGFTSPVDDLGSHNAPSHPELLAGLSEQWAANGFDIKQAVRWVALSEAFDRSSVISAGNSKDFPASTSVALFSRAYSLQPNYESTTAGLKFLANGGRPQFTDPSEVDPGALLAARGGQILKPSRNGNRNSNTTVPMGQLLSPRHVAAIKSIAKSELTAEQRLDHLVMLIHARRANSDERELANEIFDKAGSTPLAKTLEQVAWALLNSK